MFSFLWMYTCTMKPLPGKENGHEGFTVSEISPQPLFQPCYPAAGSWWCLIKPVRCLSLQKIALTPWPLQLTGPFCILLFLKILVQSFMPSFGGFFISVSLRLQENIFAFMTTGVSAHLLPSQHLSYFFLIFFPKYFLPSIFLIFILLSSSTVISFWER